MDVTGTTAMSLCVSPPPVGNLREYSCGGGTGAREKVETNVSQNPKLSDGTLQYSGHILLAKA